MKILPSLSIGKLSLGSRHHQLREPLDRVERGGSCTSYAPALTALSPIAPSKDLRRQASELRKEVEGKLSDTMSRCDKGAFEAAFNDWRPEWDRETGRSDMSPLMLSLDKDPYFTKRLLERGSDRRYSIARGPNEGLNALTHGIRVGASVSRLRGLIGNQPVLDGEDIAGETCLSAAIRLGRKDVVRLLFQRGAAWSRPHGLLDDDGAEIKKYLKLARDCGQPAIEAFLCDATDVDGDVLLYRTFCSDHMVGTIGEDLGYQVKPCPLLDGLSI